MSKKDIIHWTNAHAGNDVVTADFWFVNRSPKKVKTENRKSMRKVSIIS